MKEIDEMLAFNREYVQGKRYEKHVTDGKPKRKTLILTCMDTRLSVMLPDALGISNGDCKVVKVAGGVIQDDYGSVIRSILVGIYELGIKEIMVIHHTDCGACHMSGTHMVELMRNCGITPEQIAEADSHTPLTQWLDGFHHTEESVRTTVRTIRHHPLVPTSVSVRGFIIDSKTGELKVVRL